MATNQSDKNQPKRDQPNRTDETEPVRNPADDDADLEDEEDMDEDEDDMDEESEDLDDELGRNATD